MSGVVAAGRRRPPMVVAPPMTDDFSGTLSGVKWPNQDGGPSNVSGRLRVVPTAAYPGVASDVIFNLMQYPLSVEIPTLPIAGNGTIQTRFLASNSNYTNLVEFQLTGNSRIIYMAGIGIAGSQIAYDATAHRWFRFRIDTGNLLWETSPDKSVWTIRKTISAPSFVTAGLVRVVLQSVQTGATEATPGYAEFDNFNL